MKISLSLPLSLQETQQKVTRHDGRKRERLLSFLAISFYLLVAPALLRRDRHDNVEPEVQVIYGHLKEAHAKV